MAYAASSGRKPMERASKISHSNVILNEAVSELLSECAVPRAADPAVVSDLAQPLPPAEGNIRAVVAVDGSMREVNVRDEYPSATVTFFAFGPLLFNLESLRDLDDMPFISPEDLARLKNIQRYSLAVPTRNVSRNGMNLRDSVRRTLHDFLRKTTTNDEPLYTSLRFLIFRRWQTASSTTWTLPGCPNDNCNEKDIVLNADAPDEFPCSVCGHSIYLIDVARLHERVDEEQGASGVSSYILTLLEHLALVQVIAMIWRLKPAMLGEVLFVKDGPLALFGQVAPLSKPLREMVEFFARDKRLAVNITGLEKSGAFVEHAAQIEDRIEPNSVILLSNEYIYRYIIPGDPSSTEPYGFNTYWGGKLIYRAEDSNLYVATVPLRDSASTSRGLDDFVNLPDVLGVVGSLRCSMYDNALLPIALANKLVSLSEVPSKRILETFVREVVRR